MLKTRQHLQQTCEVLGRSSAPTAMYIQYAPTAVMQHITVALVEGQLELQTIYCDSHL